MSNIIPKIIDTSSGTLNAGQIELSFTSSYSRPSDFPLVRVFEANTGTITTLSTYKPMFVSMVTSVYQIGEYLLYVKLSNDDEIYIEKIGDERIASFYKFNGGTPIQLWEQSYFGSGNNVAFLTFTTINVDSSKYGTDKLMAINTGRASSTTLDYSGILNVLNNSIFKKDNVATIGTGNYISIEGGYVYDYFFVPFRESLTEESIEYTYGYEFPGPESEESDTEGTFDITSDNQSVPNVPSVGATDTGFVRLYNPSLSQLRQFSQFLWSELFDLDTFKKLFGDPMGAILGLSIVPVAVPVSGAETVVIGNVSSGVTMNAISSQYVSISCGSVFIDEFYGSALDYAPYTKISIYLPYIGERQLDTDEVMNQELSVTYNIDILNGGCVCFIKVGGSILYQFSGSVSSLIPVNSSNWQSAINNIISTVSTVAIAGVASGAGGAAATIANINAGSQLASSVANSKPNIIHASNTSGGVGLLGIQTPFITIQRPLQSLATNYNKFVGYPSNITSQLSALSGYTQIEDVHLENLSATQSEIDEIEALLKGGVLL